MLIFIDKPFAQCAEYYVFIAIDIELWGSDEPVENFLETYPQTRELIQIEGEQEDGSSPQLNKNELFALDGTDKFLYVVGLYSINENAPWSLSEVLSSLEEAHTTKDPIAIFNIGNSNTGALCGAVPEDLRRELQDSSLLFYMYTS